MPLKTVKWQAKEVKLVPWYHRVAYPLAAVKEDGPQIRKYTEYASHSALSEICSNYDPILVQCSNMPHFAAMPMISCQQRKITFV